MDEAQRPDVGPDESPPDRPSKAGVCASISSSSKRRQKPVAPVRGDLAKALFDGGAKISLARAYLFGAPTQLLNASAPVHPWTQEAHENAPFAGLVRWHAIATLGGSKTTHLARRGSSSRESAGVLILPPAPRTMQRNAQKSCAVPGPHTQTPRILDEIVPRTEAALHDAPPSAPRAGPAF